MTRTHQPGHTLFRSILPEDIDWKPSEPCPYVIRVKVPLNPTDDPRNQR